MGGRIAVTKPKTYHKTRNFDEFGELGSNHQTLTFQHKATKQNKHQK